MKIAFLSLGCKVNAYETEKMKQEFMEAGFEIVDFNEVSDVYVVNTCTVTNIADRKSRQMLHRAKKHNENALVVACGCYVDSKEDDNLEKEGILCIENIRKYDVVNIVLEKLHISKNENTNEAADVSADFMGKKGAHVRAFIKVQDGCNQFCSYCIIPFVRGELKSRDEKSVEKEVKDLVSLGYKEVVITGIHVSSYGVDKVYAGEKINSDTFIKLDGKPLLSLLSRLNDIEGLERIRLSSLEPRIITEDFIESLSKLKKVCPHFHLSLQSGCEETLKSMNRHYTAEEYYKGTCIIRKYYENPAITTDIIVGFPGETEENFKETMAFVDKVRFQDVHVFKYSKRQGTVAAARKDQVSDRDKSDRSKVLIMKAAEHLEEYCNYYTGKEVEVLIEEIIEMDGEKYFTGYTKNYVKVYILCHKVSDSGALAAFINRIVKVRGIKAEDGRLYAE
ncbi:MAG: tRNA (N(6)-L-threonylcarbamoyladenosine(37)-C(2))-methylthiotransferase MtaB [Lachnospiraceae bacterium]|nr:tRNA (N(6)-L-threonylcarbamoyladenosine(37)-C(2))-methylthiotransferase MtaB [Lachnospiraceae bacterium]